MVILVAYPSATWPLQPQIPMIICEKTAKIAGVLKSMEKYNTSPEIIHKKTDKKTQLAMI